MSGYYEVKRSGDQYMFNLKAGNHEIILTSERYTTKAAMMNGIESVRKNSLSDARYQRKTAADGRFYFTLTASNGQVIGQSQMYQSEPSRNGGIESVKTNGPSDTVKDTN